MLIALLTEIVSGIVLVKGMAKGRPYLDYFWVFSSNAPGSPVRRWLIFKRSELVFMPDAVIKLLLDITDGTI